MMRMWDRSSANTMDRKMRLYDQSLMITGRDGEPTMYRSAQLATAGSTDCSYSSGIERFQLIHREYVTEPGLIHKFDGCQMS